MGEPLTPAELTAKIAELNETKTSYIYVKRQIAAAKEQIIADGLKGDSGADGADGADGLTGATGADGLKGDKGDNGADGAKGDKGDSGADGANGADGAKGDSGANGADGAKGDKGDNGANGAKGDKGDSGANGGLLIQSLGSLSSATSGQLGDVVLYNSELYICFGGGASPGTYVWRQISLGSQI